MGVCNKAQDLKLQKHDSRSADCERTTRDADTVDSSWVIRATNTVIATTLRSEGVGRLRMVGAECGKHVKQNYDQVFRCIGLVAVVQPTSRGDL